VGYFSAVKGIDVTGIISLLHIHTICQRNLQLTNPNPNQEIETENKKDEAEALIYKLEKIRKKEDDGDE